MALASLVEAVSAGVGAGLATAEYLRRALARARVKDQAELERNIQAIVNKSMLDLGAKQAAAEQRQGRHLDRQDKAIQRLHDRMTALERRP